MHKIDIKPISEDKFYQIDYKVMELAFAIHNEMGRFWDETIYKNELARRCREIGFEKVMTEAPVYACYDSFEKLHKIDLLINNSIVYELKTVRSLSEDHLKQALHYLFLLGLQHGKLVNFRPESVEYRFVSTRLTPERRFNYKIIDSEYQTFDNDSAWLKNLITNLLKEWGAFLDINLFYEAINHFRGGKEHVVKEITVACDSHILGEQSAHLLSPRTAFKISGVIRETENYEKHLRRFIKYTELKAIQWINFNHHEIVFKTILK